MQEDRSTCVIYAAKSTADEQGSIASQLEECRAYAERNGWAVDAEFSDAAVSAFKKSRGPGLVAATKRAAELAANGKEALLLAYASDRLARGDGATAKHLVQYLLDARQEGYRLASVTESLDDLAMVALLGERANMDSKAKGEHVRRGKHAAALRGRRAGGPRPFGFEHKIIGVDSVTRKPITKLTPVTAEARIVKRVFREFVKGATQAGIARGLATDQIKTSRGGRWHQNQVSALLRSRLYIGDVIHKGEWFPGEHKPIIDKELFDAAQTMLQGPQHRGGRPAKEAFLLGEGLLKCGDCGSTMRVQTQRKRPRQSEHWRTRYICLGRTSGSHPECTMPPVRRDRIDPVVFDYFEKVALDLDGMRDQANEQLEHQRAEIAAQREQAERELAQAEERLARVRRDYQNGRLDADDWKDQRDQLQEETQAASAAVERLEQRACALEAEGAVLLSRADVLDHLAAFRAAVAGEIRDAESVRAARSALRTVFEYFVLHRDISRMIERAKGIAEERGHGPNITFMGDRTFLEPVLRDDAIERPWRFDKHGEVVEPQEVRRIALPSGRKPQASQR